MTSRKASSSLAAAVCAALAILPGAARADVGDVLRAAFPDQARRVLEQPSGFARAGDALFAEGRGGEVLVLPKGGDGVLRFALGPGLEVRVREVGAAGEVLPAERAVAYPRAGGTSFWAAEREGLEEWLALDAPAVRRDVAVAAWEVEGAGLRQRGDALELTDEQGVAWMTVTAPEAWAASGRPVAARLEARGSRIELYVDAEGEAVLVDPAWRRTRSMAKGRTMHTATLLEGGRVLVVGGSDNDQLSCPPSSDALSPAGCSLDSVEIYDPATQTWSEAAPLNTPRVAHTATRLGDGRVLVTGGINYRGPGSLTLDSAEIYDPEANTWTVVPNPMLQARAYHVAVRIDPPAPHPGVLIASGCDSTDTEFFDPETNTWTANGQMTIATVAGRTATLLHDGRVFLVGGSFKSLFTATRTDFWNPDTGAWNQGPQLSLARSFHTATLLDEKPFLHMVLVTGGKTQLTTEVYNTNTGRWHSTKAMSTDRIGHTATLLGDHTVLVAGGVTPPSDATTGSCELFDPKLDGFRPTSSMHDPRSGHTATRLDDGSVLVTGGLTAATAGTPALASAEIFDPNEDNWSFASPATRLGRPSEATHRGLAPMPAPRAYHTATLLEDGRVLLAGGQPSLEGALLSAVLVDPDRKVWTEAAPMHVPRTAHSATMLRDGTVLVVGGSWDARLSPIDGAELYHPGEDRWTSTGSLILARASHTATLLRDGRVLVVGGTTSTPAGVTDPHAEIYDPADGAFHAAGKMSAGRINHTATLLADGRVLVTGGTSGDLVGATGGVAANHDGVLASAEIFDPVAGTWKVVHAMTYSRASHAAVRLADGRVLVMGGTGLATDTATSAEIYDPVQDAWQTMKPMNRGRAGHLAIALDEGHVLVAEGQSADLQAEIYDVHGDTWTLASWNVLVRTGFAATALDDGRVLVTDGFVDDGNGPVATRSFEIFARLPEGSACGSAAECVSGVCIDGLCCDRVCGSGCLTCSIANGAPADGVCFEAQHCGNYACNGETPQACYTSCTSSSECATGYACKATGECVTADDIYVDEGCALASDTSRRRPAAPIALALVAAVAALRRRPWGKPARNSFRRS